MALLSAVLPNSLSLSHFTHPNQKGSKHVLGGQVRVPSLRKKGSHLTVRSFKGVVLPPLDLAPFSDGAVIQKPDKVKRKDFPKDFMFGASTSAIQTEGAGDEGGRGPSTWDDMIKYADGVKGYAINSYNQYKEDVKLLKEIGLDSYRFSISWSRILPKGTVSGGINPDGIKFYNNLIDELCKNGIKPFVTLFHFDLPTTLQDDYNGFLNRRIVDDFKAYADICFKNFGDRVKYWTTINEPQVYGAHGFKVDKNDPKAAIYPFLASHHIILAHAAAAKLYKGTYQPTQGGEIGITSQSQWFEPYSADSVRDKEAAERAMDFSTDWFIEPLVYGDYPFSMKALIGDVLPTFSAKDKELITGSYDFIGVNYYTSTYAKSIPKTPDDKYTAFDKYQHVELLPVNDHGTLIGEQTPGRKNIYTYPEGLTHVLLHLKEDYNNPKIYITENGYPENLDKMVPLQDAQEDIGRIKSMYAHLHAVREAIRKGVNVKGYFQWALMDCMEVGARYTVRFGLGYVDYNNGFKRYLKKSATWLHSFLEGYEH